MVQTRDTSTDIVVGPVVLVGMMGVGKTSVGHALAKLLDFAHVDSDVEIEKAANRSIAEIFAEFGEPYFRDGEVRVMERLIETPQQVVSTGGGAFIQTPIRALLKGRGVTVWLDASLDLLWERVRLKKGRPLLEQDDPYGTLKELLRLRNPIYAQADLHIKVTPDMDQTAVANAIIAGLKTIPQGAAT